MGGKASIKAVPSKGKEHELQRAEPSRGMRSFEEFEQMFERMFEGLSPGRWMHRYGWESPFGEMMRSMERQLPRADVIDREKDILVRAEIPGLVKEDIDITVTDNSLTLKGESHRESKEEQGDYYRSEISQESFCRTIALPSEVNPDAAKAKFENGILEVTLPKLQTTRRRNIKIV